MPKNLVKTKKDEKYWKKAEELTKKKFGSIENHYDYVMGIFKRMKGINETFNEIRKNAGLINENYENLSAEEIYHKGLNNPENFDFKKGFNNLIENDKDGLWIYMAGISWKTFDFKAGSKDLISKSKDGIWICKAGKNWDEFDYEKGFEVLKKIGGKWFKEANKYWPKTYDEKLKDVKNKYKENKIVKERPKLKR